MAFFNLFKKKTPQLQAAVAVNGREAAANFTKDRSIIWAPSAEEIVNPPAATRREILTAARYMVTNSSLFERALQVSENYGVGQGIICNAATPDQEFNKAATALFDSWANSVFSSSNHALTFYQVQKLLVRELLTAGEVFLVLQKTPNGYPQVWVVASESVRHSGKKEDKSIDGVFYNDFGQALAIQVFTGNGYVTIPADNFIHLMRVKNIQQRRGTSMLETALNPGRDVKDLFENETRSVKVHSALAIVIKKQRGSLDVNDPLVTGGITPSAEVTESMVETGLAVKKAIPGAGYVLAPGEDIELKSSDRSTQGFHNFTQSLLRDVCAGIGLPYEFLLNSEKLSGAGIRFIVADAAAYFESLQTLVCDAALRRLYSWVISINIKNGNLAAPKQGSPYAVTFGLPKSITVDQSKSDNASIALLQNSQLTYDQYFSKLGLDYREQLRQRAEEERYINELANEFGVPVARLRTLTAGAPVIEEAPSETQEPSEETPEETQKAA